MFSAPPSQGITAEDSSLKTIQFYGLGASAVVASLPIDSPSNLATISARGRSAKRGAGIMLWQFAER
jgi:hypothetical protein